MASTSKNWQPNLADMIRLSKQFSATDRLLLAKTLLDSLVGEGNVTSADPTTVDELTTAADEAMVREREAFLALHPTLLAQYPNEYVAIYNKKLVDHDKDGLALTLRVYQRFPNEFVWIAPLHADALEEWVMRSPRFEPVN